MKRIIKMLIIVGISAVVAFAGRQRQADDFDVMYWKQIVSQNKILASDSVVQLFIEAPECVSLETSSLGFPRFQLGGRMKWVDNHGRGWLIECVTNWDAKAQVKSNGSEEVHIYPQEFKSSLIYEAKEEKK